MLCGNGQFRTQHGFWHGQHGFAHFTYAWFMVFSHESDFEQITLLKPSFIGFRAGFKLRTFQSQGACSAIWATVHGRWLTYLCLIWPVCIFRFYLYLSLEIINPLERTIVGQKCVAGFLYSFQTFVNKYIYTSPSNC